MKKSLKEYIEEIAMLAKDMKTAHDASDDKKLNIAYQSILRTYFVALWVDEVIDHDKNEREWFPDAEYKYRKIKSILVEGYGLVYAGADSMISETYDKIEYDPHISMYKCYINDECITEFGERYVLRVEYSYHDVRTE